MMKKIIPCIFGLAASSSVYASTIDTKSVKVEFVGYKAPVMADLAGSFKTIQYTFGKDTRSIVGVLQNASATIVPTSSEIPDNEIATDNMNKVFFPTLLGKNNIKVTFIKVVEGEDTGLLRAKVMIGKELSIVPLDLHNFSQGEKALKALSDAAAGHAGITWGNVELIFTADVK